MLHTLIISIYTEKIPAMKRHRKIKVFAIILAGILLTWFVEIEVFVPRRVLGHSWEPNGGADYLKTRLDVFSTVNAQMRGDTLILEGNRRYLVKYCNFGTLWLTYLKKNYTAKYVHTMSSNDW